VSRTGAKKSKKSRAISVYSNLSQKFKTKKEAKIKQYAAYLATLPKNPIKRILYHLHPKNFFKYWFSKRGMIMALKILGITVLVLCLFVGGLFVYFRKDLDAIRPGELNKSVQSTVNTYLDRNGQLLWEDKGSGDYKLVVEGDQLSQFLKDATVSIEDRDFYKHNGVSISGITRAFFNNIGGGSTQGGSTLTQQLVKQVFFADEAQLRGIAGIPRKIKELVLSIEVERMYNKDQILNLYLNESPYGGRRNGAESGAQTYFGKAAKDLTLPEAALLAAIPQNPSVFNPYNIEGHDALLSRQHTVLDNMAELGYVTKDQAEEAKKYPIIDHINPESTQYAGIKAPHFVQMVQAELENTLGKATVGKGGLTVKTTLDIRVQAKVEEAMNDMFNSSTPKQAGFTNGSSVVEDTKTGQIIALLGSRDFNWPGYGQDNASTAYVQPGSTVKALVFSNLIEKKPTGQVNYGSGSILKDENIDALYGAQLQNWDKGFLGNVTVRTALATSRNVTAVKAMYISGVQSTIDLIHKMGAPSYCSEGNDTTVGLAAAIGGCGIKQTELVNAYSTLSRQGVYKPQSTVLEVKNTNGEILQKWADVAGDQIIDPQTAYIISDILSDDAARTPLYGSQPRGMYIPGVKTAAKTGTSDKDGRAKDLWMATYSPVIAVSVWLGNPDTTVLNYGFSSMPGPIVAKIMEYVHKDIYAAEGLWKSGDWFTQPSGIQRVGNELFPSWWNKTQGQTTVKMTFDKVSKKKATALTPEAARIELDVIKMIDPVTKKDIFTAPDGYDASADDDAHLVSDAMPKATISVTDGATKNTAKISVVLTAGKFPITSASIKVNGNEVTTMTASGSYTYTIPKTSATTSEASVTVTDSGYYTTPDTAASTKIPAYNS